MNDKALLRKQLRAGYPGPEGRAEESRLLCAHVLASGWYRQCDTLCGYVPLKREADVTPILADALRSGRRLLLPRVEGPGIMTLRRVTDLAELVPGAYGIPEPPENAPVEELPEDALLLVPLEGIDERGMRLGKGGGYYDRLLAGWHGRSLGMVMSWQWTDRVPADEWDRPLKGAADCRGIRCWE